MATRLPRTTLTIMLTVGKDDDLIAWLASIPQGEKQPTVKRLLREAIGQCQDNGNQLAQIAKDTAWLRAALNEMPAWMEGLLSRISAMKPSEASNANVKAVRTGQLSDEGVTRRARHIAKADW